MSVLAAAILGAVVLMALLRPQLGPVRVQPHMAAIAGALLMMAVGLVAPKEAWSSLRFMGAPMLT